MLGGAGSRRTSRHTLPSLHAHRARKRAQRLCAVLDQEGPEGNMLRRAPAARALHIRQQKPSSLQAQLVHLRDAHAHS